MLDRETDRGTDLVTLLIAAECVIYRKGWGRCRWVSLSPSLLNPDSDDEFIRKFQGEYEAGDVHQRSSQESYRELQYSTSGFAPIKVWL